MAETQIRDTLDTNLIVHYLMRDNLEQFRSVRALLATGYRHDIPDLALTEAVYVFDRHYGMERAEIVFVLQYFLSQFDEFLNYNRALFELVFPYYEEHPALSFNDCCMAFYAELNGAEPLFTFDRTLAKQHPSAKRLE